MKCALQDDIIEMIDVSMVMSSGDYKPLSGCWRKPWKAYLDIEKNLVYEPAVIVAIFWGARWHRKMSGRSKSVEVRTASHHQEDGGCVNHRTFEALQYSGASRQWRRRLDAHNPKR